MKLYILSKSWVSLSSGLHNQVPKYNGDFSYFLPILPSAYLVWLLVFTFVFARDQFFCDCTYISFKTFFSLRCSRLNNFIELCTKIRSPAVQKLGKPTDAGHGLPRASRQKNLYVSLREGLLYFISPLFKKIHIILTIFHTFLWFCCE